ncbi:MAG: extracellular solute-binding protein [Pseudomonadota bacterium]
MTSCRFTRRRPLPQFAATALFATLAASSLVGADGNWSNVSANEAVTRHHALSLIGEPKFGPDFKHFDWVNPDAPKSGTIKQWQEGSFDSLNPFSIKGESAVGLGLISETMMVTSPDEPSTEYCLLCEWVSHPADFSSVTFRLRDGAKFSDGSLITVEDVVFSLEALKKANPQYRFYYKNVVKAEATSDREITFRFDTKNNRELPLIVGQLPIISKAYWTGKKADGKPRDISSSSLEVPIGSGPYRIKSIVPGRSIVYERIADWWADDLPVMRGQYNFRTIQFEYFRSRTAAFESFKSGQIEFWRENTAKSWATEYTFPAVTNGLVQRQRIKTGGVAPMVGFAFNLRREKFQDVRVRKALALAFNFEAINETLLFSQYFRTDSYFDNSELASTGLPTGAELAHLETVRDMVPAELFTTEFKVPVGGDDRAHRPNLAAAFRLLQAAGWKRQGRLLRNDKGETLKVELLLGTPTFERHGQRYLADVKRLGVDASIRIVDSAQYERKRQNFDYDMTVVGFGQSLSPGNEQRFYWGSQTADQAGSRNAMGIKNPAIDKLIDAIIFSKDRADLVAATRALDRVLLWNHYLVPMWHYPFERFAYWDKFAHPEKFPSLNPSYIRTWWVDPEKEKKLAQAQR